jgi:hypothetical protein
MKFLVIYLSSESRPWPRGRDELFLTNTTELNPFPLSQLMRET